MLIKSVVEAARQNVQVDFHQKSDNVSQTVFPLRLISYNVPPNFICPLDGLM
jgi:hypothetical protein